jgi:hypothetical protein
MAKTLRSFPLPGSSPLSPRSPAFTSWLFLLVVSIPHPCLHGSGIRDLKALLHRGVRSRCAALPLRPSRCSHGLLDRSRPCLPRFRASEMRVSLFAPLGEYPRGVPEARAPGKAKSLGFVWLRGPELSPYPRVRRPPVRSAHSPKTVALPHRPTALRRSSRSWARRPDPKAEPWPRRRRDPEGPADDSRAPRRVRAFRAPQHRESPDSRRSRALRAVRDARRCIVHPKVHPAARHSCLPLRRRDPLRVPPEGRPAERGRTPKGSPWLPTTPGNPGIGSGQTDMDPS